MNLPILKFPDDKLRTKASKVETVDDTIKALVKDMFETMYNSDGIGLAATQVNQHLQVVVMDVPDSGEDYQLILENRNTENKKLLIGKHPLCFIVSSTVSTLLALVRSLSSGNFKIGRFITLLRCF
jgi:peptide deformylase